MTAIKRNYDEECVISAPPGIRKYYAVGIVIPILSIVAGLDAIDRRAADVYHVQSILALIVIGVLLAAWYRFYRDFVDEVRVGPGYLVARRGFVSHVLTLEQIEQVRCSRLGRGDVERIELTLSQPGALGRCVAFMPQEGWRTIWPGTHITQVLAHRARDNA